jgi:hypothetical protein
MLGVQNAKKCVIRDKFPTLTAKRQEKKAEKK